MLIIPSPAIIPIRWPELRITKPPAYRHPMASATESSINKPYTIKNRIIEVSTFFTSFLNVADGLVTDKGTLSGVTGYKDSGLIIQGNFLKKKDMKFIYCNSLFTGTV